VIANNVPEKSELLNQTALMQAFFHQFQRKYRCFSQGET